MSSAEMTEIQSDLDDAIQNLHRAEGLIFDAVTRKNADLLHSARDEYYDAVADLRDINNQLSDQARLEKKELDARPPYETFVMVRDVYLGGLRRILKHLNVEFLKRENAQNEWYFELRAAYGELNLWLAANNNRTRK